MQAHIRDVLANGDPAGESYILSWAAWGIQNPGERVGAVLILRGAEGTGKGVFLHALRDIFGIHGLHESNIERLTGKLMLLYKVPSISLPTKYRGAAGATQTGSSR